MDLYQPQYSDYDRAASNRGDGMDVRPGGQADQQVGARRRQSSREAKAQRRAKRDAPGMTENDTHSCSSLSAWETFPGFC